MDPQLFGAFTVKITWRNDDFEVKDNEVMMSELKELHVSFWNVALLGQTEGRGAT